MAGNDSLLGFLARASFWHLMESRRRHTPIVFLISSPCLKNVHKSYCSFHTIYLLYYARGIIAAALPKRQQGEDPRFLHISVCSSSGPIAECRLIHICTHTSIIAYKSTLYHANYTMQTPPHPLNPTTSNPPSHPHSRRHHNRNPLPARPSRHARTRSTRRRRRHEPSQRALPTNNGAQAARPRALRALHRNAARSRQPTRRLAPTPGNPARGRDAGGGADAGRGAADIAGDDLGREGGRQALHARCLGGVGEDGGRGDDGVGAVDHEVGAVVCLFQVVVVDDFEDVVEPERYRFAGGPGVGAGVGDVG